MKTKINKQITAYREILRTLDSWDDFLLESSGLPGPRGNLELAHAVALEGNTAQFARWRSLDVAQAPTNSPQEFLVFCGVLGLGRLLAEGDLQELTTLRPYASDPRWRTREGVATALQYLGEASMETLLSAMEEWSQGNPYEQRAAAAALCEPALLHNEDHTRRILEILDAITMSISCITDRKSEAFKTLRKGLGYCWSVAVAAAPEAGKPIMERWLTSTDKDIRWMMKENLKKQRLIRLDAAWVEKWSALFLH